MLQVCDELHSNDIKYCSSTLLPLVEDSEAMTFYREQD